MTTERSEHFALSSLHSYGVYSDVISMYGIVKGYISRPELSLRFVEKECSYDLRCDRLLSSEFHGTSNPCPSSKCELKVTQCNSWARRHS